MANNPLSGYVSPITGKTIYASVPTTTPAASVASSVKTSSSSSVTHGSPSISTSAPTPAAAASTPAVGYFSPQAGFSRVADLFTFNYSGDTLGIGTSSQPAGSFFSGALKTATAVAAIGSLSYAGASAASFFGGSAATGAGTAAAGGTAAGALKWLIPGAVGAVGASLLFDKSGPVTVTPTQSTPGNQTTNQTSYDYSTKNQNQTANYNIYGSPGASINGTQSASQPSTMTATPYFSQQPTQDTSTATGGTNWVLIAAIAAGAYILFKR